MKLFLSLYLPAMFFLATCLVLYFWHTPVDVFKALISGHNLISYVVFVLLLMIATVFMPVTVMPIIPMTAPVFGPFLTGVLSVIGWTTGAVIAFLIARYLGRPAVSRFLSLEQIDAYAAKIPPDAQFVGIVLVRLVLPVDIMSYVIGLTSSIDVLRYTLATVIGVAWFSFAFAYLGNAFYMGDMLALIVFATLSLVIFVLGWYTLWRHRNQGH